MMTTEKTFNPFLFRIVPHENYVIKPNESTVTLFSIIKHRSFWNHINHVNLLNICDDNDLLQDFDRRLVNVSKKRRTTEVFYISFNNHSLHSVPTQDVERITFYHADDLETFLDNMIELTDVILKDIKRRHDTTTGANRKYTFFIMDLSEDEMKKIKKKENLTKLSYCFQHSPQTRLIFFIRILSKENVSQEFLEQFGWINFMGSENIDFCEKTIDLPLTVFNERRPVVGLVYRKDRQALFQVHQMKVERSDYAKAYDEHVIAREKSFQMITKLLLSRRKKELER